MKAKQFHAFTLIELLVVIAIIGILAAILLPVLQSAVARAKQAQCVSNLKQWAMAQQVYSNDNNSGLVSDGMPTMVVNGTPEQGGGDWCNAAGPPYGTPLDPYAWFNQLPQMMGDQPLATNYDQESGGRGISGNNKAYQYMPFPGKTGRMWECPSASMLVSTIENGTLQECDNPPPGDPGPGGTGFFSYDMNIDLKRDPTDSTGSLSLFNDTMPKMTSFRQPASTVLMFDCVFDPITEVVNGSPGYNSVNPANRWRSFAARHNGGGIISFLDGHAAYYKDTYITNNPSNPNGPSAAEEPLLPDVIWNAVYRNAEVGAQ